MAWSNFHLGLAFMMTAFGSIFTIFSKWGDREVAEGTPGYPRRMFNHPFFQALAMFAGEILCGLAFIVILIYRKNKGRSPREALGKMTFNLKEIFTQKGGLSRSFFVFFLPAMCDAIGSSLLFMALNYTTAASYQMLRGSVIIFTALLSMAFLRRKMGWDKWIGIIGVICGLVIVGLSDFLLQDSDNSTLSTTMVITGDLLIVVDQIIASFQFILEEKFIDNLDADPLLAVGLEGFYGFIVLGLLSIPMYFISVGPQFSNSPEYRLEDVLDAFAQMRNDWHILVAIVGIVIVAALFNWASISVTKYLSATTRTVLDACRVIIIWAFTLGVGWQDFQWLQIIGFVALTLGIFIYNQILTMGMVKNAATCSCPEEKEDLEKEKKPEPKKVPVYVEKSPVPKEDIVVVETSEF